MRRNDMFTGIIQKTAPILSVTYEKECLRVRIKKPLGWKLTLGQSIALDGVCSTVISHKPAFFEVDYMPETLAKTTVKMFKKNQIVNLEKPLTLKDFVNGGLVQGHVDTCGTVKKIEKNGKTAILHITIPEALKKYIATKGAVTVNGVNLTVVRRVKSVFSVALIPYTLMQTNLGLLKNGDRVNVEVDVIARYVAAALNRK
jgi:riboflavin synthase